MWLHVGIRTFTINIPSASLGLTKVVSYIVIANGSSRLEMKPEATSVLRFVQYYSFYSQEYTTNDIGCLHEVIYRLPCNA